jgi:hydroxyacylglutathione hydrolase
LKKKVFVFLQTLSSFLNDIRRKLPMKPLTIQRFTLGELHTNSYVVTDDETFSIIIDPGENPFEMMDYVRKRKVDYILLTHCHFDHIAGLNMVKDYTDASVVVHQSEAEWLLDPSLNRSIETISPIVSEWPDILLQGDELIQCGALTIKAIHTPGHSPGSTCFLLNGKYLFTGDTLLSGVVGPTNIPFGDRDRLKDSIRSKLFCLPGEISIYPGHGGNTTIEFERSNNLLPNMKNFH